MSCQTSSTPCLQGVRLKFGGLALDPANHVKCNSTPKPPPHQRIEAVHDQRSHLFAVSAESSHWTWRRMNGRSRAAVPRTAKRWGARAVRPGHTRCRVRGKPRAPSPGATELGQAAQERVRARPEALPRLRRPVGDHRGDHRIAGHREDPHALGPAGPGTAVRASPWVAAFIASLSETRIGRFPRAGAIPAALSPVALGDRGLLDDPHPVRYRSVM